MGRAASFASSTAGDGLRHARAVARHFCDATEMSEGKDQPDRVPAPRDAGIACRAAGAG